MVLHDWLDLLAAISPFSPLALEILRQVRDSRNARRNLKPEDDGENGSPE